MDQYRSLLGFASSPEDGNQSCFPSLSFKERVIGFAVCFGLGKQVFLLLFFYFITIISSTFMKRTNLLNAFRYRGKLSINGVNRQHCFWSSRTFRYFLHNRKRSIIDRVKHNFSFDKLKGKLIIFFSKIFLQNLISHRLH